MPLEGTFLHSLIHAVSTVRSSTIGTACCAPRHQSLNSLPTKRGNRPLQENSAPFMEDSMNHRLVHVRGDITLDWTSTTEVAPFLLNGKSVETKPGTSDAMTTTAFWGGAIFLANIIHSATESSRTEHTIFDNSTELPPDLAVQLELKEVAARIETPWHIISPLKAHTATATITSAHQQLTLDTDLDDATTKDLQKLLETVQTTEEQHHRPLIISVYCLQVTSMLFRHPPPDCDRIKIGSSSFDTPIHQWSINLIDKTKTTAVVCTYDTTAIDARKLTHSMWDIEKFLKDTTSQAMHDEVLRLKELRGYCSLTYDPITAIPTLVAIDPNKPATPERCSGSQEETMPPPAQPNLLVIDDMDLGFRDRSEEWEKVLDELNRGTKIYIILARKIPDLLNDPFWRTLATQHAERTTVILSANKLRENAANISRRISWERTVMDLWREIHTNERLRPLLQFSSLIVRFGVTACAHFLENACTFYYDPDALDGVFRDQYREGGVVGSNSVLLATLATYTLDNKPTEEAIKAGIRNCQKMFRRGYGQSVLELIRYSNRQSWVPREVFRKDHEELRIGSVTIRDQPPEAWSILGDHDCRALYLMAMSIVEWGVDRALNPGKPPQPKRDAHENLLRHAWEGEQGIGSRDFYIPVTKLGKLAVLDREEIENYRSVQAVMRAYLRKEPGSNERPLSIAVFGQPGSGKSFGVKEIAKTIAPDDLEVISFNVAQFTKVDDLNNALIKVRDVGLRNKRPLVFFDEFDCSIEDVELAWLKQFLAPMEDGAFYFNGGTLRTGSAIFVFAGGVCTNYKKFYEKIDSRATEGTKGKDFLSRLRGYIDIKGVNLTEDALAPNAHAFCRVRRAVVLRALLKKREWTDEVRGALVDPAVYQTMLDPEVVYRHGIRSMRAILHMCTPLNKVVEKMSLPAEGQLDLHVDGRTFVTKMATYAKEET